MTMPMYSPAENNIHCINDAGHIREFLLYHKLRNHSKGTLRSYEQFLSRFLVEFNKPLETLETNDIRAFLMSEEGRGNKATTLATKISILKSYYSWLDREEYLPGKNPMRRIDKPSLPPPFPKFLTHDELESLRESCNTLMDKVTVEVLYCTGARVSEFVAFDWPDFDLEAKRAIIRNGKGGKTRVVFLSTKAARLLRAYKATRKDDDHCVFRSREGRRMSKETVEWRIRSLGKQAGIEKRVTPHRLRHTIATHLLPRLSLEGVQKYLGHTKASTTQIYAIVQMDLLEQDYRLAVP